MKSRFSAINEKLQTNKMITIHVKQPEKRNFGIRPLVWNTYRLFIFNNRGHEIYIFNVDIFDHGMRYDQGSSYLDNRCPISYR
jgi:hypothetical protein